MKNIWRKEDNKIDERDGALENQILVLENRLSEIINKISMPSRKDDPEELDREYYEVLKKLQEIKEGKDTIVRELL